MGNNMKLLSTVSDSIKNMPDDDIVKLADKHITKFTCNKITGVENQRAVFIESLYDIQVGMLAPFIEDVLGRTEFERLVLEGINDGTQGSDEEDDEGMIEPGWRQMMLEELSSWLKISETNKET